MSAVLRWSVPPDEGRSQGRQGRPRPETDGERDTLNTEFTLNQKRALAVLTLIALLFGAYFLRSYFVLIVVAAVGSYLFTPLFNWFNKRLNIGLSVTCTVLSALASVIVPIGLLVVLAFVQIA